MHALSAQGYTALLRDGELVLQTTDALGATCTHTCQPAFSLFQWSAHVFDVIAHTRRYMLTVTYQRPSLMKKSEVSVYVNGALISTGAVRRHVLPASLQCRPV